MDEPKKFRYLSWLKKRTRLEKILCFVIVSCLLAVAVITAAIAYLGYNYNLDSKRSDVCLTPGCVKAASLILSSLDEKIDPCDDFYQFACGQWRKTHSIPDEKSHVSIVDEATDKLNLRLKTLLETKIDVSDPSFISKAKEMYSSCIDVNSIEQAGAKPLQNVLKTLGGWPVVEGRNWNRNTFDWIETLISLRKLGYNHNILLGLLVQVDSRQNSRYIIHLEETSLGMSDRSYLINGLNDTATAAYYKKMVKAATLLGANEATAEKELLEALQFEITLANYSLPNEEKRNTSRFYNKYTVKKLQKFVPQVSWTKFIKGLLMDEIYENETLNVEVPEFVKNVVHLIINTEKRVIANYMCWRVIDESLEYLSKEWRDIDVEYFKVLTGESQEKPRWEQCLYNNLNTALSSYYVRHYFSNETKQEVSELVKYIHNQFLSILDETDWMDEETKAHAKAKANNMLFYVGYPDELLNNSLVIEHYKHLLISKNYFENNFRIQKWFVDLRFSMLRKPNDRTDWRKNSNAIMVNAFNSFHDNSIALSAGYLQSPYFDREHPNYMNFALIGTTIGHEITHGFDDEGRQYDKDGNNINWWAETTDEKFKKKAQCIIDLYSNYTTEIGIKVNGVNTQGENIADIGGLKESYWAYQSWVKDNGLEQLLPGLNYNQNQLFWISAAYDSCSKYRPEVLKENIISDYHSPNEFRVIGPMSNLVEFAKDFNCSPGSRMVEKNRCQVW